MRKLFTQENTKIWANKGKVLLFRTSVKNGWNRFRGGYLDTRECQKDYAKTGNLLCVSTATSPKRDGKSGTWKVIKVQVSQSKKASKELFDSNA